MIRTLSEQEKKHIQQTLRDTGYHLDGGSYEEAGSKKTAKYWLTIDFNGRTYGAKLAERLHEILDAEIYINGMKLEKPQTYSLV